MYRYPPFHTIYSHALGCVCMRCHSPHYWILLEHIGTTWNLYDPKRNVLDSPECALPPVPEMHSCTDVQLPSPFHIIHSHALGTSGVYLKCVAILPTTGYDWNILEPPKNLWEPSWILLDVPCPHYQSEDNEDCGLVKKSESLQFLSARSVPCE